MRNRFKSWALWMSIAALIVFCVKEFANIDIFSHLVGCIFISGMVSFAAQKVFSLM